MSIALKLLEFLVKGKLLKLGGQSCSDGRKAQLEVERKFCLSDDEYESLPEKLGSLGFTAAAAVEMTDTFLPTIDDKEMMRVRVEKGCCVSHVTLTAKSWFTTPDGGRERQEAERQIAAAVGQALVLAGRLLAGSALLSLSKYRQMFVGKLSGLACVVSIDQARELGQYSGCYLEVEILVPIGADVTPAREQIAAFARELLGDGREPVQLSYREMLKLSLQEQ